MKAGSSASKRAEARANRPTPVGTTQSQRVYRVLRDEILMCRLVPGSKLNIAQLAKSHDASLGAVREALAMLEKEWLVVFEPQKGYAVTPVSSADLLDITLARIEIEKACLASSIAHGDIEWESSLVASFHRMSRIGTKSDVLHHADADWIDAHGSFHAALVAACRSQRLLVTRTLLYEQSERYRRLSVSFSVERDVDAEHRALLEAALDRNTAKAQQLIEAHIKGTAEALIDAQI